MEENKMKYHLTITDNETGEVHADYDINAIVGGILVDRAGTTASIAVTDCKGLELAATIKAAELTVQHLYAEDLVLRLAAKIIDTKKAPQTETDNN